MQLIICGPPENVFSGTSRKGHNLVLRFEPVGILLLQEVEAIDIFEVIPATLLAVLTRGNVPNVILVEDGDAEGVWLVRWHVFCIDGDMRDVIPGGRRQNRLLKVKKL